MRALGDDLRHDLREPLGPLYTDDGEINAALRGVRRIATIGDISTLRVARQVRPPDLAIVDYKTQRHRELPSAERDEISAIGERVVTVANAPGTISDALWRAIERAYDQRGSTRIEVEGEEDLATLPAVSLAPVGTRVVYGLPGRGMVIIKVNAESQTQVQGFLERMREN